MHFYETRLYKLWYFETNACAVMSWEPRMLQESRGVLCVRPCTHAARKLGPVSVSEIHTFIWLQFSAGGIDSLKPSQPPWAAWNIKHQLKNFPLKILTFLTFTPSKGKGIEQYSLRSDVAGWMHDHLKVINVFYITVGLISVLFHWLVTD